MMAVVTPQFEFASVPLGGVRTESSLSRSAINRVPRLFQDIVPIPLGHEHIADIARLHFQELSWSLNGHFGQSHIQDLYQALAESPHFFGYAYFVKDELVGFVTGTSDFEDTRRRIMSVYRRKIGTMLLILLRNPRFLIAAIESKFLVPRVFHSLGTKAEWLTFITDTRKGYIAPFAAMRLIDSVRDHFRELGVSKYVAQGYKVNPRAMALYERLRWQIAKRFYMHVVYSYPTDLK